MRAIRIGALLTIIAAAAGVLAMSQAVEGDEGGREGKLVVSLERVPNLVQPGPGRLPLRVVFENVGRGPVRLLKVFDANAQQVFFGFTVKKSDGTPLLGLSGGGKIDIAEDRRRQVQLEPGEGFFVTVDLNTFLEEGSLRPGKYTVSVIYRNQYGNDCFKGILDSEPIAIEVR